MYVVGGEYSFSTLVGVAMVWKNGVPTALSSGQQDATATQVAISGTDVLIAGVREPFVGSGTEESVLWKNGIMNSLSNGRSGWASQLVVSHGDVYVAGIHDDRRANYWKNGQEVFLNDGTNIAYVNGLLVSGSDVYGVGEEFVNDHAVGRIWKNGTPISLDNVNNDVYLYRMVIR